MRKSEKYKKISKGFRVGGFPFYLLSALGSWKLGGREKVSKLFQIFRKFRKYNLKVLKKLTPQKAKCRKHL